MRVITWTGSVMAFVMMRQIMLDVILTVATVVGIISTLNIVLFVLVMNDTNIWFRFNMLCTSISLFFQVSLAKSLALPLSSNSFYNAPIKEIEIIHRLFLVVAMYCQDSSSNVQWITKPPMLVAGWEGSLGTCSR